LTLALRLSPAGPRVPWLTATAPAELDITPAEAVELLRIARAQQACEGSGVPQSDAALAGSGQHVGCLVVAAATPRPPLCCLCR